MICTSPRSGSTLLCRLLQNSGVAGHPGSHFHKTSLDHWLDAYGLERSAFATEQEATRAVFDAGIARGKGGSDIFGLRLQRHSFGFFAAQLAAMYPSLSNTRSRIHAAFGSTIFIHLTRRNKLHQAISYVKAEQSGLWHLAPDGTEIERLSEPKAPVYDQKALAAQLREFVDMDAAWREWFKADGITPLVIDYDALSADPFAERDYVLNVMGLECPNQEDGVPVAKLSDALNEAWAQQFRKDFPDLSQGF